MRLKTSLYLSVAAIGVAVLLSTPTAQLRAQQSAPPGVSIGDGDLGGVVSGPNGPEAGVWVIAETTDLPTKFVKIVVTDDQGRYVLPESAEGQLQRLGARLRPGRFAQDRDRARQDPQPHRGAGAERGRGGGILSGDLLVCDAQDSGQERVPGHRAERQRHAGQDEEPGAVARRGQDQWLLRLPSARQQGDAHDPEGARHIRELGRGLGAAHPVRAGAGQHGARHRPARHASARSSCSPTGPTGSPPANCRPPSRRVRRASSATSSSRMWDWADPKAYLHDEISTDKRKPTVNAYGKIYGVDRGQHRLSSRCSIPRRNTATDDQDAGARSEDADIEEQQPWRRRPIGATRRSGTARPACTIR